MFLGQIPIHPKVKKYIKGFADKQTFDASGFSKLVQKIKGSGWQGYVDAYFLALHLANTVERLESPAETLMQSVKQEKLLSPLRAFDPAYVIKSNVRPPASAEEQFLLGVKGRVVSAALDVRDFYFNNQDQSWIRPTPEEQLLEKTTNPRFLQQAQEVETGFIQSFQTAFPNKGDLIVGIN